MTVAAGYALVGLGGYTLGVIVMAVAARWLLKRDGYR